VCPSCNGTKKSQVETERVRRVKVVVVYSTKGHIRAEVPDGFDVTIETVCSTCDYVYGKETVYRSS
jgi:hypothetical protein